MDRIMFDGLIVPCPPDFPIKGKKVIYYTVADARLSQERDEWMMKYLPHLNIKESTELLGVSQRSICVACHRLGIEISELGKYRAQLAKSYYHRKMEGIILPHKTLEEALNNLDSLIRDFEIFKEENKCPKKVKKEKKPVVKVEKKVKKKTEGKSSGTKGGIGIPSGKAEGTVVRTDERHNMPSNRTETKRKELRTLPKDYGVCVANCVLRNRNIYQRVMCNERVGGPCKYQEATTVDVNKYH